MKAKPDTKRAAYGVTLVETMVAVAIILVAVTGATFYQYYTVLDARKADLHVEATRLAVTMLEGWKGAGSETDFDPYLYLGNGNAADCRGDLGLDYGAPSLPPPGMNSPVTLGDVGYTIISDGVQYSVTLFYEDQDPDDNVPMAINAFVKWPGRGHGDVDKSFSLTTYEGY